MTSRLSWQGLASVEAVSNFHNFTSGLSEAAVYELRNHLKQRKLIAGEVIFRGGDAPDHLFQLSSGTVALTNHSADGLDIILSKYLPGDRFGYNGIIDGRPRINTALALEDSQLLTLARQDFQMLCEKHPEIQRSYSIMLANHVRMLLNLLVDASLLRLPGRIVRTLQRLLLSMGKQDADGHSYIECSHEEIARYVAASRQSTSLEQKKLEQSGIIRSAYGKIYVLDRAALAESCDTLTSFEPVAALYEEDPAS